MNHRTKLYLIGKPPEKHRNDHTPPQFSHDIEQTKAPNPQDCKWTKESRAKSVEKTISKRFRVDVAAHGIQDEPESPEKGDEWKNNSVEESLL